MDREKTFLLDPGATISSQLEKLANENPEKPAFVFWDKNMKRTVVTRQEVWDKGRRFAAVLRHHGIVKGDIVCNTLVNSPDRLITSYGTILAGAASMHGQTSLADGEDILKNWKDSKCKGVIFDPQHKEITAILDSIQYMDENVGKTRYRDLPSLSVIIPVALGNDDNSKTLLHDLDNEPQKYVDVSVSQDDMAFVLATSGTTGFAKLVPQSHRTILQTGVAFSHSLIEATPKSVFFNHRSFGWGAGLPIVYLVSGITRVAVDHSPGLPEDVGALIVHILNFENCDTSLLIAPDVQLVLNALDTRANLAKLLRVFGIGGGPLSTTSMTAIGRITKSINVVYASSEMGLTFFLKVEDSASYENSCVGYAGASVEFKILGDNMEEVPAGQSGEICVRGPSVAKGYLNNQELSKETFLEDGWYRTSDIGHVNGKGQLFVYCRKSNAINCKGNVLYPGFMEARINKHPGIQKSIIVGVPDPVHYEELCICLIKSPQVDLTKNDVSEFCKTLFLARESGSTSTVPKHYLFVDSFPLNCNGKIDRRALRTKALKHLDIHL